MALAHDMRDKKEAEGEESQADEDPGLVDETSGSPEYAPKTETV
jgi:hypothetical protein